MIVVTEKSLPILKNLCLAFLHFGTLIWTLYRPSSGSNVPVCIIGFQWHSSVSNSQRWRLYETYSASSHINHRLLYHSQGYCCTVAQWRGSWIISIDITLMHRLTKKGEILQTLEIKFALFKISGGMSRQCNTTTNWIELWIKLVSWNYAD